MSQVVRNATGHLTLDLADAVIGMRRRGRGCHGVTMMAAVLAWGEARMMCDASSEEDTRTRTGKRDIHGLFDHLGCSNKPKNCPKHGFTCFMGSVLINLFQVGGDSGIEKLSCMITEAARCGSKFH
eukprot:scaffold22743_cov41-Cyclotella_meneghiniana.AAC.4